MIIPIRCFTCGKPIAQDWEKYDEEVKKGRSPKEVLDELKYKRICCRRMFLTHVDLFKDIAKYKNYKR